MIVYDERDVLVLDYVLDANFEIHTYRVERDGPPVIHIGADRYGTPVEMRLRPVAPIVIRCPRDGDEDWMLRALAVEYPGDAHTYVWDRWSACYHDGVFDYTGPVSIALQCIAWAERNGLADVAAVSSSGWPTTSDPRYIVNQNSKFIASHHARYGPGAGPALRHATGLRWLAERVGGRLTDALIVTTGPVAYRRSDGIAVVPAALLGP